MLCCKGKLSGKKARFEASEAERDIDSFPSLSSRYCGVMTWAHAACLSDLKLERRTSCWSFNHG